MEVQTASDGQSGGGLMEGDAINDTQQENANSQSTKNDVPDPSRTADGEQKETSDNGDEEQVEKESGETHTPSEDREKEIVTTSKTTTVCCIPCRSKATAEEEAPSAGGQQEAGMSFRGKMIRTVCAQAAYLGVTLNLGMIGPSLLDLEMLTHSTTQEMSTVFTWRAVLGLVASLLLGPVLDHVNRFFVVGVALGADVIFIAAAPWTTHIAALMATMALPEFFNSAIGMGTHLICVSVWGKDSGPSFQALNLMATIGYTLSPLLCKPFLAPSKQVIQLEENATLSPQTTFSLQTNGGYEMKSNISLSNPLNELNSNNISLGGGLYTSSNEPETNIQYAYLIVAIYDLLIASFAFVLFTKDGRKIKLAPSEQETKEENFGQLRSKKFIITICILFFMFNVFYGGIEVGYAGLLMTFAVKYLGWSKADGTNVTAVLQASNAIVTASAILISKWVRAEVMLRWSIGVVTLAMLALSLAVDQSAAVLWVCTACLGVGYATIMPCSYTWVNEVMEVSGKFSSAYWAGFFTGFMLVPAITGQLFYHVHPMWLPYVTLICSVGMSVMFTIISIVIHKSGGPQQKEKAEIELTRF